MGEYQGEFTVTGANLPEDGKTQVENLAIERVKGIARVKGCGISIVICEDTIIGNQRTWRCYAYSLDRQSEFEAHMDAKTG